MPARYIRNAAIRAERFLQYRKLQFSGPSTLSLGTRQDLNLAHSHPVTSQMNHLCRNLRQSRTEPKSAHRTLTMELRIQIGEDVPIELIDFTIRDQPEVVDV
ncbi:hypothetical protein LPB79_32115 (plasmid) [Rhizobium sp. T136]|nr:hypothetical protein [Rhizobium sp. T136]UFS85125.1 hypothetical protein LPB79_32115 [Rhizobium sp. T136]